MLHAFRYGIFTFQPVNREFYASLNEKLVIEMEYGLADKNIPGVVEPVLDRNNPTLAVDSVCIQRTNNICFKSREHNMKSM